MRIGYIMFNSLPEKIEEDINRLEAVGCDKIYKELLEHEEKRPQWKKLIKEVGRNDEVVILGLNNALRGLPQLAAFFEVCRIKKVRIISLNDRFDSFDRMFPASTLQLVNAIGSFPGDILSLKASSARIRAARISAAKKKKKSSFQISRDEREKRCIELYNNGACIEDIKQEVGFRSNSSVYRILKNNGVKVNRRVAKEVSEE